jgi:hypothetical protein
MTFLLTPTNILLGSCAADRNACIGTALPVKRSNRECRPFPPPRSAQSQRIAFDHQPRAQTNRLLFTRLNSIPTSRANKPLPLFP